MNSEPERRRLSVTPRERAVLVAMRRGHQIRIEAGAAKPFSLPGGGMGRIPACIVDRLSAQNWIAPNVGGRFAITAQGRRAAEAPLATVRA